MPDFEEWSDVDSDGLDGDETARLAHERMGEVLAADVDEFHETERDLAAHDMLRDGIAEACHDDSDYDMHRATPYIDSLTDATGYTKRKFRKRIEAKVDKLKRESEADAGAGSIKELIEDKCELTINETTDHTQDTKYRWDFGDFHVKTVGSQSQNGGRYHLTEVQFYDEVLAASHTSYRRTGMDQSEWRDFIEHYIERNGTVDSFDGMRTCAVEELEGRIQETTAYWPLEATFVYGGGLFIPKNNDPFKVADSDHVWVPATIIADVIDEYSISTSALYSELSARGNIPDGISGGTVRPSVGGRKHRYWVLERTFAEPADYRINPDELNDPKDYLSLQKDKLNERDNDE